MPVGSNFWHKDELKRLSELWESGVPTKDIAKTLAKSVNGTRTKAYRMGLRKKSTVKKIAKTNSERAAKTGANIILRVTKANDGACLSNNCKHLAYAPRYVCYTHAA